MWPVILVTGALGFVVAGCSISPAARPSASSGSTATTTVDEQAVSQAVAAVNLVLDLAPDAPAIGQRLARVQDHSAIAAAVRAELNRLAGAGVVGVSVSGGAGQPPAVCRSAVAASPCVLVHYKLVTNGKPPAGAKTFAAYVVSSDGTWVLSRASACRLPRPVGGKTGFAQPSHPTC